MARRYLNKMPGPPDLLNKFPPATPADEIFAQWVTQYDPRWNNDPEPPLLEIYQSHLAWPVDAANNPAPPLKEENEAAGPEAENPETDPHRDFGLDPEIWQPALEHFRELLESLGWELADSDSNKDFSHYYLKQPPGQEWQPTKKLFQELSGYNRSVKDNWD